MSKIPVTVAGVVRRQARERGAAPAILFNERVISYSELDMRSNQVANGLVAAGVGAGDRVAFLDKNCPAFFEVLFGGAKLNAVNVGVNWRLSANEIAYTVNDAKAICLFVGPDFYPVIEEIEQKLETVRTIVALGAHQRWRSYETWLAESEADDPGVEAAPADVALQLYTSGTTGLPKGAMLTNANLDCLFDGVASEWEFDSDSVNLIASPLFNIAGGGWALLGMHCGCRSVLVRDVTPAGLLAAIPAHRVTNALLVPALLQFLLQTPGCDVTDFSSLRAIVYGASPISEKVLAASMRTFGCHFIQAYALTEHTGAVTILRHEEHDLENPGRLRSAGRPHPWIELRIVDTATGLDEGTGLVGEVWLRSCQVMKGYWNRPEETALTITEEGWLRTGDVGYLDADGFLYLHDRVKDMIISGGQNIYPAEVENALMEHPDVADVAVIGVPDERWGETVKAIVVARAESQPDPASILAHARTRIAHFKCPTSIDFVPALPRNPSGKVLKRELREPYWVGRERRIN